MGRSTVHTIIKETCAILWDILQPLHIPTPDVMTWKQIAEGFENRWNFPNCIGGIDGKHIRWRAPPLSGSVYFNYKGIHSIVLLTVVDAEGRFDITDVGMYAGNSDGGVLKDSPFGIPTLGHSTSNYPAWH